MPNRTFHHHRSTTAVVLISILAASLANAQSVRKGELSARQIAQRTFPSVVVLVAEDRTGDKYLGSGFFVDDDVVATNFHVIKGATKIIARRVGQKHVYQVSVVSTDEENDLALLKVQGAIARPLTLARGSRIAVGDVVYVAGNPEGLEGTFSQGIVSALRGKDYVQITAAISHGSSGGPVLNNRGEVIGVAVGAIEEGQNLNFAIPIPHLLPLIAQSKRSSLVDRLIAKKQSQTLPNDPLDEAVAKLTNGASTYVRTGNNLNSQHDYDQAIDAFKEALRRTDNYIPALYGLADSYEGLERYQEAIDVYNDIIRIGTREERAYEQLGFWILAMKLNRYEEAIDLLKRGIDAMPNVSSLYVSLALLLESQNKMTEAEVFLRSGTRSADNPGVIYDALTDLFCDHSRRCDEAISILKSAIESAPQDGQLHYAMGKAYLKAGDRSSAMKEYQLLKSLNRTYADLLFDKIYK